MTFDAVPINVPKAELRLPFALSVLLAASTGCHAATVEQTIDECWVDHDHPAMALCVEDRAKAARSHLAAVERRLQSEIASSPESAKFVARARSDFTKSAKSYVAYKRDQCALRASLAVTGNGAPEVGLACEAELDSLRASQLEASM